MATLGEGIGTVSSLGAVIATFVALPLVPPEAKIATAAVAVGLWAVGVVGLAPHLRQPSNTQRPATGKPV